MRIPENYFEVYNIWILVNGQGVDVLQITHNQPLSSTQAQIGSTAQSSYAAIVPPMYYH